MEKTINKIYEDTKENLELALNRIRALKPYELTDKIATQTKEQYKNAQNPLLMLQIALKTNSAATLLSNAQTYIENSPVSDESKAEYKQLIFTAATAMNPNVNLEHLETDIEVTIVTCPTQEEMDTAIEVIKHKIQTLGILSRTPAMVN